MYHTQIQALTMTTMNAHLVGDVSNIAIKDCRKSVQVGEAYSIVSPQLDQLRLCALGSQLSAPDS